tara:strand:+ start:1109 stop:1894 length:786 start_codon:yes stop_codon:yes gene_type:complete
MDEQYAGGLSPAQIRFKQREKKGLDGLTGQKPGTPQLSGRERAQNLAKDRIAQGKTISQVNQENQAAMRNRAAQRNQASQSGGGQQQQQQGGQQAAQKKPGFLQRVKNRLGQVKQGISDTARGAASLGKRVAGGVADAATGGLTDFDKKGGRVTGAARVVGGAVDKLTGDRTDLDRRGATPLNKGQQNQVNRNQNSQSGGGGNTQTNQGGQQNQVNRNQNLPPSQRPGSQKNTLIQRLRNKRDMAGTGAATKPFMNNKASF